MVQKLSESSMYRKAEDLIASGERNNDAEKIAKWSVVKERLIFVRQNLARAASRGDKSHDINIRLDDIYEIGDAQNWNCAFTGTPLEFTRGGTNWGGKWCNPNSCTIDRIDSSKGYVKGNIQLVTWRVNCIKRDLPDDEFIEICKLVSQTR